MLQLAACRPLLPGRDTTAGPSTQLLTSAATILQRSFFSSVSLLLLFYTNLGFTVLNMCCLILLTPAELQNKITESPELEGTLEDH